MFILLHRWDAQGGNGRNGLQEMAKDVNQGNPEDGPKNTISLNKIRAHISRPRLT